MKLIGMTVAAAFLAAWAYGQDKPPMPGGGGPKPPPQDPRKEGGKPAMAPCGKHPGPTLCGECQKICKEYEEKRGKVEGKSDKKEVRKMSDKDKKHRKERALKECHHRHDHRVTKSFPTDGDKKVEKDLRKGGDKQENRK